VGEFGRKPERTKTTKQHSGRLKNALWQRKQHVIRGDFLFITGRWEILHILRIRMLQPSKDFLLKKTRIARALFHSPLPPQPFLQLRLSASPLT
jgi:hypothetical protein